MIHVFGSIHTNIQLNLSQEDKASETLIHAEGSVIDIGGHGAIQAISAARCGAKVSAIAAIGDDIFAQSCLDTLRKEGVHTSGISRRDEQTGFCLTLNQGQETAKQIITQGANKHTQVNQIPDIHLNERALVITSNDMKDYKIKQLLDRAHSSEAQTILCLQAGHDIPVDCLRHPNIIITDGSRQEALLSALSVKSHKELARLTHEQGTYVVITHDFGTNGATLFTKHGSNHITNKNDLPHNDGGILDVTGCFDIFSGFFAACIQAGLPLQRTLSFASKAARTASQSVGQYQSIPYLGHLDHIEKENLGKNNIAI